MAIQLRGEISADPSDLIRAAKVGAAGLDKLSEAGKNAGVGIQKGMREAGTAMEGDLGGGVEKARKSLDSFVEQGKKAETITDKLTSATKRSGDAMEGDLGGGADKARKSLDSFVKQEKKAETTTDKLADGMREAGDAMVDDLGGGAGKARNSLGRFVKQGKKAEIATDKLTSSAKRFGSVAPGVFGAVAKGLKTVTVAAGIAGAAISAIAIGSVVEFAKFETKFAQVSTLIDNASTKEIRKLQQGVRGLAVTYGSDLLNATTSAYDAISAGQEPAKVVDFLSVAFKGAAAGAATVTESTNALTTAMNSFVAEGLSAGKASDILFATIKAGKTTMPELAQSLGQVTSIAATAGVKFFEVGAALASLTAGGLDTATATTSLKAIIVSIISPSASAAKALKEIGVSAKSLAKEGLGVTMKKVSDAVKSGNQSFSDLFPNVKAFGAAAVLAGDGLKQFEKNLISTANSTGATETAFSKIAATLTFKFNVMVASVKDTFLQLGEELKPFAEELIDGLTPFFESTNKEFKALTRIFASSVDSMADDVGDLSKKVEKSGGAISVVLTGASDAMRLFASGVMSASKPIAGAITGLELVFNVLKVVVLGVVTAIVGAFDGLLIGIEVFVSGMAKAAKAVGADDAYKKLERAQLALQGAIKGTGETLQGLSADIVSTTDKITSANDSYIKHLTTIGNLGSSIEVAAGKIDKFRKDTLAAEIAQTKLKETEAKLTVKTKALSEATKVVTTDIIALKTASDATASSVTVLSNSISTEAEEMDNSGDRIQAFGSQLTRLSATWKEENERRIAEWERFRGGVEKTGNTIQTFGTQMTRASAEHKRLNDEGIAAWKRFRSGAEEAEVAGVSALDAVGAAAGKTKQQIDAIAKAFQEASAGASVFGIQSGQAGLSVSGPELTARQRNQLRGQAREAGVTDQAGFNAFLQSMGIGSGTLSASSLNRSQRNQFREQAREAGVTTQAGFDEFLQSQGVVRHRGGMLEGNGAFQGAKGEGIVNTQATEFIGRDGLAFLNSLGRGRATTAKTVNIDVAAPSLIINQHGQSVTSVMDTRREARRLQGEMFLAVRRGVNEGARA